MYVLGIRKRGKGMFYTLPFQLFYLALLIYGPKDMPSFIAISFACTQGCHPRLQQEVGMGSLQYM